ncbi:hypothetical protein FSP39_019110 [Pinctada imbricata]|uniref:Uncharacterized protein n=1 Tax=Pinctada imbricata TaxID=66713 RepID=A0AA88YK80_PINIB|nr:hypothetical protein FSP39_019110 [Pinctada imbricata]
MSCFMQAVIWNTWGPITESAEVVFNWQDSTIGMLANWGIISYICTIFPACYLMDMKGLRISLLLCNFLLALGSGLRCITSDPHWATWLMNIGAIINGIAGTVPYAGPSLLASTWFPPNQRATATAVSSALNYFGVGMGYIIDLINMNDLESDIMQMMYYECVASCSLFLATLIYFPSKPPTPPSKTASIQRVEYRRALLDAARNRYLWMLSLAYALPMGIYGVWGGTLMDIILQPLDITQVYAACIISGMCLTGTIPLFYELCSEVAYPVSEGVAGGFITLFHGLFGFIFLLILLIPGIGISWMNYTLLGSVGIGLIVLILFPEHYTRTDIDIKVEDGVNHTEITKQIM